MIQLCHQIIHYDLARTYYKINFSEKVQAINNKFEHKKTQYNLDRQTSKISALSSEYVNKYKFLASKDVLPEKDVLGKAAGIKRFEYSAIGKELKKQNSVA